MKKILLTLSILVSAAVGANAQLLITQYYEGGSTNKWLEITNVSSGDLSDISGFYITLWQNANTEAWKTNGTASQSLQLSGTLSAGQSLVMGNTSNGTEIDYLGSYSPLIDNNSVINFNGDDSIVLYSSSTFTTGNILDALSFTDSGNEGADTSIMRLNTGVGYNLTGGSTFEDFPSVWSDIGVTAAQDALAGTDARIGYSSVPEPTAAALLGAGAMVLLLRRRRQA